MTEGEPLEPITPDPATTPAGQTPTEPVAMDAVPTDTAPTEPVPAATTQGPPPWPDAPVGSGEPPRSGPATVAVPRWALIVAGAVAITLLAFAVGFAAGWTAADEDDDAMLRMPNRELAPGNDGNGNGNNGNGNNGNGNGTTPLPGVRRAFLGVATEASTDPPGARVQEVVADSPAAEAELEVDDVITKVDDDAVESPEDLARLIGAHRDGDEVTLTFVRDGETETEDVTLVRRATFELPTPSTTQPEF